MPKGISKGKLLTKLADILNVDINNVIVGNQSQIHTGEYNVNEFQFIFSDEYLGLIKKAIFKVQIA